MNTGQHSTVQHSPRQWRQRSKVLSCLRVGVFAFGIAFGTGFGVIATSHADDAVPVGKTTLVIGIAYIEQNGKKVRLKSGQAIYDNRQIITSGNGYVHIRFDDQGLVSVRPNSRLNIEKYHYNSVKPAASTVKFNLVKGSARSVSGKAAKAARQRFRMNTPLAAIGVRGTDFVVRADQQNVQAIVNEGAIVVAPFSDQCSVDSLGPCAVFNAVELQGNTQQLLKFNHLLDAPELLPASERTLRDQLEHEVDDTEGDNSKKRGDKANYALYSERQANQTLDDASPTPIVTDFTPSAAVATPSLTDKQLVWGRWADPLASDKIVLSYAEASADRRVTVGNSQYVLFRQGLGSQQVQSGLGAVSFALDSAQANYVVNGNRSAMTVQGGFLNINFNNNSFDTQLNLQHSATGDMSITAGGKIADGGYFNSRTPDQQLSGAVSLDGKEAGYLFHKELNNATVEGVTLWDAVP